MRAKLVHHNAVILKGDQDGIKISLDPSISFAELKRHLKNRVEDKKQFFEGARSNISFTGRSLSLDEEQILMDLIIKETAINAPVELPPAIPFNMDMLMPGSEGLKHYAMDITNVSDTRSVYSTMFHKGLLRSGQMIRYNGSVVVLGDANPGSEIIADGNVIVLGALKGMVHAGFENNKDCFIYGSVLWPTQIRIADKVTVIPEDKRNKRPAHAYIQDGQIFVAQLT